MDLSKFKTSDWLKIGGAAIFFVFGFFSWISIDYAGIDGLGAAGDSGGNVFDFFWTGTLPWLLVMAVAVITVLLVLDVIKAGTTPWPVIMLAATGLAALLLIIRLLFNPIEGKDTLEAFGAEVGRGIGMIVSTVGGLVAFAGAFLGFKESGGDIGDLTDMNKLKGQFGGSTGGSAGGTPPPPPPPPGMTPPPPPPPMA